MDPLTIALDGPAGSGKSTLGTALARDLGYAILDIGIVYRLVTARTLASNGVLTDESTVVASAEAVLRSLEVQAREGETVLLLDGTPVAISDLHSAEVTKGVPFVAMHESARKRVRTLQRTIAQRSRAILVGRDIGTVVLPNAELKLYLDVSLEERAARRRWSLPSDDFRSQSDIAGELAERDRLDAERHHSPLRIPEDAVVLSSDRLSVDETVSLIVAMCGLRPHAIAGSAA
jgi:cytidylate kinase